MSEPRSDRTVWRHPAVTVTVGVLVGIAIRLAIATAFPTPAARRPEQAPQADGPSMDGDRTSESERLRQPPRDDAPEGPHAPTPTAKPAHAEESPDAQELDLPYTYSPADLAEWKMLFEIYAEHGRMEDFRKAVDAVPTTPLGVAPADYRQWVTSNKDAALYEYAESAAKRLGNRNFKMKSPLASGDFSVALFAAEGAFESTAGKQAQMTTEYPKQHAMAMVGKLGYVLPGLSTKVPSAETNGPYPELTERQWEDVLAWTEATVATRRATRERAWAIVKRTVEQGGADELRPTSTRAVLIEDWKCHVVPSGADPELESLIAEYERLRAAQEAALTDRLK